MSGLVSTPLRAPAAWDAAPARRVAREPLRTHSIKAPSSFLRRACPDGRLPAQAQHPDPGTGSGTPMVTGQPPAHHSRRKRARAPTRTPCAKKETASAQEPASQLPASRSQARSLLLPADRPAPTSEPTDPGWSLPPSPDPAPHRPKKPAHRTPPPSRQSGPFTHDITHNLLPEPTTESLCRHNQIPPSSLKTVLFPPLPKKHQAPHP